MYRIEFINDNNYTYILHIEFINYTYIFYTSNLLNLSNFNEFLSKI